MAMNRTQFKKELQLGLNSVFGLEYRQHAEKWRKYLTVETEGKKAYVEDVMLAGFGAAPTKAEGAGVAYQSTSEIYTARYVFETIALAFAITEEAEEDNLYGSVGARLSRALSRAMQHTKAVRGANILNNGFSASFLGGDGVALFSTAHLGEGSQVSNMLATAADLSETSLEDILTMIADMQDYRGIPIALQAMKLVIATANRFTAQRILFSDLQADSAEHNINAIKDLGILQGGSVVMDERLTDPDAWFVTTNCPDGLKHIVRKTVSKGIEGDFESGNMRYKARERYINGWSDWHGAVGTAGGG